MALNFRPYPFREDQYSGKDTAETISSGLKTLGDTFSEYGEQKRMRERQEMDRKRLEDDRRLQTLKLAMDEGLDPSVIDEYLNNPNAGRAPKRILSPMQNPRPLLSSNRLNLPADFQSSPDVPSFPMGTKRIQAQEDRDLSRRNTESMISEREAKGRALAQNGGKPPAGYRWTPEGSLEAIPGGPAYMKAGEKSGDMNAALNLYETARKGLLDGLRQTNTGPIMGRIPAFTSGQQIAQGGVAAMAPVLKQLFRVAGEGVFTDRDQQLLLDMIPTRTANPDAITTQMENIDNIVRAKLRMPRQGGEPASPGASEGKIRVRNRQTGQTGSISPQFFNDQKYERLP